MSIGDPCVNVLMCTRKPPFPRAGGRNIGWAWHGQRGSISEVDRGEKWFSTPEGQKRITNQESKSEKFSVKSAGLEPFGFTPGGWSLDLLSSLGFCWPVLRYALGRPWRLVQKRSNMPTWEWNLFLHWHVFLFINSLGSEHRFYFHLKVVLAAIGGLRAEEYALTSTFLARSLGVDGRRGPHHLPPWVPSCQAHLHWGAVGARSGRMGSEVPPRIRAVQQVWSLFMSVCIFQCQRASSIDGRGKKKGFLSLMQHGKRNI